MALIKCPDCGKEYSSFAKSCPQCGCPNEGGSEQTTSKGVICPDCGKEVDSTAKTCPYCGCPMPESTPTGNKPKSELHCPDCGRVVDSKMNTCPNCGCVLKKDEGNAQFVKSSLLPDEKILCSAKWHWINYVLPAILFLAALVFFITAVSDFDDNWFSLIIALFCGGLGYLGILEMKKYEFVVTNKRIFIKMGLILRASYELRLEKLESIQVYQGILGRFLNFGIVLVHGVGASRQLAGMLVAPMAFRQHIFAEISKQNDFKEE